jgi:hypothetical protein
MTAEMGAIRGQVSRLIAHIPPILYEHPLYTCLRPVPMLGMIGAIKSTPNTYIDGVHREIYVY